MKLFVKLLIAALVLAVLLPFTVLKGKDGRPLMSLGDLKAPDLAMPKIPDGVDLPNLKPDQGNGSAAGSLKKEDIVYQWRDEKGMLHFSSEPPPEGVEFTAKGYDPKANLIQSVKPKTEPVANAPAPAPDQSAGLTDFGSPYSPENVKKLVDDAKQIQKVLNDRYQQQDAILGGNQD